MDFSVNNLFRVAPPLSHPRRRVSRPATLSPIKMSLHERERYYRVERENVNYPWQISAFASSSRVHLIDSSIGVGVDELSRMMETR